VIILEQTINDLYIPETLTTAKDGFALMEIHNRTDSRIDLILFEPLKTVNFSESNKERFEIFHVEQFFPETKKRKYV
jgi:nucleosome binding factor SPN SPT16 subunit